MDKIKRFIDCYIPITTCNLRCKYCYITQQRLFKNEVPQFKYSPEHIGKSLSAKRLGGTCLINLCGGGETLLPNEIVDIIENLLKQGHYVMVVTNGTISKRFDEIIKLPKDLLERLMFKFSFHYLELIRLQKIDEFFENVNKVRSHGCSFTLELTPNDETIPHIEDIKKVCIEKAGAVCHITIARDDTKVEKPILTEYPINEYRKIWGQFKSELFDFKLETFNVKRKEYCYAGNWTSYLNLGTGTLSQCYGSFYNQNIFENIEKEIEFINIGNRCLESHCYNSHAFLALGAIPELKLNNYAQLRNRKCIDGTEWLTPKMKEFMTGKLYDNNELILNVNNDSTIIVLDEKKRGTNITNGIKLKRVEILEKNNREFCCGEKIKLRIECFSYIEKKDVYLRGHIYRSNNEPIDSFMNNSPVKLTSDLTSAIIWELDTANLQKGEYYIKLTLFTFDEKIGYEKQDDIKNVIDFKII